MHDMPPQRAETMMTPEEVEKAEKDLVDVRTRQVSGAQTPADVAPAAKGKAGAK